MYAIVAVVIAVVVVASAAALTDGFRKPSSGPPTTILVTEGTIDSLPIEQFNDITVTVNSGSATVNGSVVDSFGLQLYTMNLSQVHYLIVKGVVGTYLWTSGALGNATTYNIDLVFETGQWALVFDNPNAPQTYLTTSVGFTTNLDLIE